MIKNISWTAASSLLSSANQIIFIFTLAALAGSKETGLYSLTLLIISFCTVFAESGTSQFYIKENIDSGIKRFNLLLLCVLFVIPPIILLVTYTFISSFTELAPLLQIGSLILILSSFMILHQAELLRIQNYKKLAIIEITWRFIQLIIGLPLLILYDTTAYMLICITAAGYCLKSLLLFYFVSMRFELKFNKRVINDAIHFGSPLTASNFISLLRAQADQIIIAYTLGVAQLGLYSLAKELISNAHKLINSIVTRVFFSILCSADLAGKSTLTLTLKKSITWVNTLVQLVFVSAFALMANIFHVETYQQSLKVLLLLSFFAIIRPAGLTNSLLAQSITRSDVELKWNLLSSIAIIPIAVIAFISKDLVLISIGVSLTQLTATLLSFVFFGKMLKVCEISDSVKVIKVPLLFATVLTTIGLTI